GFGGGVGYEAKSANDGVHALPSRLPVENRMSHSDRKKARPSGDILLPREDENAATGRAVDVQRPYAAVGVDPHIQPQLQKASVMAFDVRGNDRREPADLFQDALHLVPAEVAEKKGNRPLCPAPSVQVGGQGVGFSGAYGHSGGDPFAPFVFLDQHAQIVGPSVRGIQSEVGLHHVTGGSDEADQPSFQGGFVAEGEVEASVFPGSAVHQITAFGLLYGGHAPSVTAAVGFDHDISMVSEKGEGLLGPFPSLGVRQVGPERSVAG